MHMFEFPLLTCSSVMPNICKIKHIDNFRYSWNPNCDPDVLHETSAVAEPPNRTEVRRTWHFRTEPNRTERKGLVRMFARKM